jgi:hypothetical protein
MAAYFSWHVEEPSLGNKIQKENHMSTCVILYIKIVVADDVIVKSTDK